MSSKVSGFITGVRGALVTFREETGQSLTLWVVIALVSLLTQIMLHQELLPGEFGTFNTALGVIGLMAMPMIALSQGFAWHATRKHEPGDEERLKGLRASELIVTETLTWYWAILGSVLLLIALPLLQLPRYQLSLFTLLNFLLAIGSLLSATMYRTDGRQWPWARLLIDMAFARLFLCIGLAWYEPWSESALAAFLIAGLITLAPALRPKEVAMTERFKALKTILDRPFLLDLAAIFSVLIAIFLFSSADRIVAQHWFGTPADNNIDYVDWPMFDAYQTAGLLARSILWGTQPLLLILFVRRARMDRTTSATMDWFWLYLGALVTGVTVIDVFHTQLAWLFCGRDYLRTAHQIPGLTMAMIPLGVLQGVGIFGLASRRYPECFAFGVCGIAYTLVLYFAGRHPQLMPAYMFGGGMISLMVVLFIGVVRWGRKQP